MDQINMQDAMLPLMEQLMFFHDHTLAILIIITMIVSNMMCIVTMWFCTISI